MPVILTDSGAPLLAAVAWMSTDWFSGKRSGSHYEAMRAVCLLYDFWVAARTRPGYAEKRLLVDFGEALRAGTIGADRECALGLNWTARGRGVADRIKRHVDRFAAFCVAAELQSDSENKALLVAVRRARATVFASGGLFGHLSRPPQGTHWLASDASKATRPEAFPEHLILKMIWDGCRRERRLRDPHLPGQLQEYNIRDQLAFLLLFGGGIRSEELFHLYGQDIRLGGDGAARVTLFHPQKGLIKWRPAGEPQPILTSREEYLQRKFGRAPRHLLDRFDNQWAGWKELLLTGSQTHKSTQVFWIFPVFGILFWELHKLYVRYVLQPARPNHPYYFISLDPRAAAKPWSLSSFKDSWKIALQRIGLEQSRHEGTNPHAARHWYGHKAAELGIDPRIRQVMMHHKNVYSQLRYQSPSPAQVNSTIQLAQARISSRVSADDPRGLLSNGDLLPDEVRSLIAKCADIEERRFALKTDVDPLGLVDSWQTFKKLGVKSDAV